MEVVKISPRGYCYGVVDAMKLVRQVAENPTAKKPIFVLGLIVHNRHAVEELDRYGVISLDGENRLELIEQVTEGTVVFTAHGVSQAVRERAEAKGLDVVDATCPDVTKTHDLIRHLADGGYTILYIGRRGHPEPEGAMGEAPDHVHLIETAADAEGLDLAGRKLAVVTQTTLSSWDTEETIQSLKEAYPQIEVFNEICLATQLRQEAAVREAARCDVVIVVGDIRSNNSNRLVQVVQEQAGRPAYLVDTVADIEPEWLAGKQTVGVTAGSSTPSPITREVVQFLEGYEPAAQATAQG
ncbi:MAG: 4-hydroxy-3-methylbut-2-enyl diphosphate reductase [Thermaerobacter sp.]|nr:4-hydroxy-3-methylbut-2-enyl diphosphate reductase [Thermaerobacter sp.]